ncbi:DUF2190 family protein [Roseicitreum antarcticum]|uniref:Predicted phage recombinase, RecA/RadA family n=1 Tax=Roseicitreum antarcticum TaxID=564137 RepID=A0A1H3ETZ3_9RHOB|nr:DUF2190 family protein [Roseicitreum antarcticum]SDX81399.1 Predicted phage recombinase, RecA/RadA family [Roseicitreum antarcticum]
MKNFMQIGEVVSLAAPRDVTSGEGMLVGKVFGIAVHDAASGAPVEVQRRGVYTHAKTSAQAWAVGAAVYWDNTNFVFTTTSSGNTLVGAALAAAVNPSATGTVLLDGTVR